MYGAHRSYSRNCALGAPETDRIVELVRRDFNLQLSLAANALILGLEALFAGLLFAGLKPGATVGRAA